MDDQTTGVTQPEGETGATQPGGEQTTQTTEGAQSTSATTGGEATKTVPYDRFKEVNDKVKEYETRFTEVQSKLNALEQQRTAQTPQDPEVQKVKTFLNQAGYVDEQKVKELLTQNEQRIREDTAVQQELAQLEMKYDGKNGLPKFDRKKVVQFALDNRLANPEVAYKTMHEKEWLNWHIQQANTKAKGVQTESSDGSGAQGAGPSNQDLMNDYMKTRDPKSMQTMLKRTSVFNKFFGK